MQPIFARAAFVLLAGALGAGCQRSDENQITVYRIPKESETPPAAAEQASAPAQVHWHAPENWEEQNASGFRKASYLVRGNDGKTADVSVISFPETAGGVLANVNRWRDQLKLAAISNVAEVGAPMPVDGRDLFFVDLISEQSVAPDGGKSRILGGIFPLPGETWFFKMMGPDALVETQRDAFKQFLQTVHAATPPMPSDAAAPAPMSANSGGNTNAPTPPPIEPSQGAPLQYVLPPGWAEKPLSPMRIASFKTTSPNEKETDVSIVSLPGMAGGDLANVNRWRNQVNLAPIDESTLAQTAEHVRANGHDYLVVDLVSDAPTGETKEKQRILAAILDENARAWFIKMTGEDAAVAAQKNAFTDFLRSLKIPQP